MAIISACTPVAGRIGCPYCFRPARVNTRHAIVGAKIVTSFGSEQRKRDERNNWRSIFGDGRRGVQERSCDSNKFISFMGFSFQTGPEFFQAIPISARRRMWRHFQQLTNFLKGVVVPEFQHDNFALGHRQFRQATHGRSFHRRLINGPLEPRVRFKFPRQPPPQGPPIIQRTIPKAPHTIVFRLFGNFLQLQQCDECLLKHILSFHMRKTERTSIEN